MEKIDCLVSVVSCALSHRLYTDIRQYHLWWKFEQTTRYLTFFCQISVRWSFAVLLPRCMTFHDQEYFIRLTETRLVIYKEKTSVFLLDDVLLNWELGERAAVYEWPSRDSEKGRISYDSKALCLLCPSNHHHRFTGHVQLWHNLPDIVPFLVIHIVSGEHCVMFHLACACELIYRYILGDTDT